MSLTKLRKRAKELNAKDSEIYGIASSVPCCEGTGSFNDDEQEHLETIISIFGEIELLINGRMENKIKAEITDLIAKSKKAKYQEDDVFINAQITALEKLLK